MSLNSETNRTFFTGHGVLKYRLGHGKGAVTGKESTISVSSTRGSI